MALDVGVRSSREVEVNSNSNHLEDTTARTELQSVEKVKSSR